PDTRRRSSRRALSSRARLSRIRRTLRHAESFADSDPSEAPGGGSRSAPALCGGRHTAEHGDHPLVSPAAAGGYRGRGWPAAVCRCAAAGTVVACAGGFRGAVGGAARAAGRGWVWLWPRLRARFLPAAAVVDRGV